MKVVELQDVYKSFGHKMALNGLSLEVYEGEIFGLLGPNGAGKSTIIHILCEFLKVDKGMVQKPSKKDMGVVPQELALFEDLSAYENVSFFASLYGLKKKELEESVHKALDFVGLDGSKKDKVKTFSGGMKRRLNIACGIAHKPRLIIMDEPTVGIDPQSRNYILSAIQKLNKVGCTVIYTTHYMEEAKILCDRIAIIDEGRLLKVGTKEQLTSMISDQSKLEIIIQDIAQVNKEHLMNIKGVIQVTFKDNQVEVISKKEIPCMSSIVKVLVEDQVDLLKIQHKDPTLEDVFLALTGKKLRD